MRTFKQYSLPALVAPLLFLLTHTFFPHQGLAYAVIEAEDYDDMSGVQLENGGTTVGFIDDGDWLRYDQIDFADGPAAMALQIAKASTGGSLELRLDALNGPLIGTFTPESTGGWQDFQPQKSNLESVTGVHDLFLVATGAAGVCNIDYFTFSDTGVYEPNWVLTWADEFNGADVDTTVWRKVYHGNPDNGELQFYTPRPVNIQVSEGTLKLIARVETFRGKGPWMPDSVTRYYTSGKIESQGRLTFQYGKFEASMKLPRGKGTWPAFWMLGENLFDAGVGWPRCGEIDIMEHGQDFDNVGAALHTETYNHTIGTQITGTYLIDDYDTEFHTYAVEWSGESMRFSVDGNYYLTVTKESMGQTVAEWPFDQPFWLILNHAVGGAWGGTPVDSLYPHTVEVDWVRVYKDQQPATSLTKPIAPRGATLAFSPNPTNRLVQVRWEGPTPAGGDAEFLVRDLQGRVVHRSTYQPDMLLDSDGWANGLYLITVTGAENVPVSGKLLVQHGR